jgi:hypothetical protein
VAPTGIPESKALHTNALTISVGVEISSAPQREQQISSSNMTDKDILIVT